MSLAEGRNQISGPESLGFLHKKHNWKILGVGNNWVWKELVQAQSTVLEEKGPGEVWIKNCTYIFEWNSCLYSEHLPHFRGKGESLREVNRQAIWIF